MEIDETDRRILGVLSKNSRLSFREIGKRLNISVVTVMKRVKKMEEAGVIKGYTAILDHEKLGSAIHALISFSIDKNAESHLNKQLEEQLSRDPSVYALYSVAGNFDVELIARFRDTKELDAFIKKLGGYEHITRTYTKLILEKHKESL